MKTDSKAKHKATSKLTSLWWNEIATILLIGVVLISCRHIVSYQFDDYRNQQVQAWAKLLVDEANDSSPTVNRSPAASPSPDDVQLADTSPYSALDPFVIMPNTTSFPSPTPTPYMVPADARQSRLKLDKLIMINPDTVGWLTLSGTEIDYPVLQSTDNEYYLRRNFLREQNVNGSIFMDYRNRHNQMDRHTILYGHNMKNRSMFADILYYESKSYFAEHPIIQFDSVGYGGRWQIFSAYFTDANVDYIRTSFDDDQDFAAFVQHITERSIYPTKVTVNARDSILTLSTCTVDAKDGRFTIHAKWIGPPQKAK